MYNMFKIGNSTNSIFPLRASTGVEVSPFLTYTNGANQEVGRVENIRPDISLSSDKDKSVKN
jgi:hypothetical protein